MPDGTDLEEIYRRESGRCVATLIRVLGDVDLAEDSVAEAFAEAAERWPVAGVPANPGAWITTTARNRAIDHLRRESTRASRQLDSRRLEEQRRGADHEVRPMMGANAEDVEVVPDDQLRLMFLCCHPALAPDVQVALTLRLLGGLETPDIARAFLVAEATMAQRLVRAKRKIRDNRISYRIPAAEDLAVRLKPVLATIYLIFNEGHSAGTGADLVKPALLVEAVRLARLVVELLPDEDEPRGLLALLLLTEARRSARTDAQGELVPLSRQDRSGWDRALIAEGHDLVRTCIARDRPGPYQVQAALAAVHADATDPADTDWGQIVALYDHLHRLQPTAIVALNRAIAVAELRGPAAGLEALSEVALDGYHLYHATRGELLSRTGRLDEAAQAFDRAVALAGNDVERRHLERRRAEVGGASKGGSVA